MKRMSVSGAMLLAATVAQAQGSVRFANRVPGLLDAPVIVKYGETLYPAHSMFVAQLYASPVGGTLAAIGAPIPFRDAPEAGYWPDEIRTIPGVAPGGTAQVKVVSWVYGLGATYEYAVSQNLARVGESDVFMVTTGGGSVPPAPMLGLTSFTVVVPFVPEPSPAALGLFGALTLLVWRR